MRSLLVIMILLLSSQSTLAGEKTWLGRARLFTNDRIGDGQDRWRTGSYGVSFMRGDSWTGVLPETFGELVEYRVRTEIIAPADLGNPVLGTDRPYVGAVHMGAFSHMKSGAADLSLGVDLVATGPNTGLGAFQSWVHNALGLGTPQVLGSQIGNAVYPTLSAEIGRDFATSSTRSRALTFRPFAEAQIGVESFLRFGGDITFGKAGMGAFQVRDSSTGHRVIALKSQQNKGLSVLAGGDVAYVAGSQYLPTASGYTVTSPRVRLRAGLYYTGEKGSVFYGLTWLGKEFAAQPESQVVGSLSLRMNF